MHNLAIWSNHNREVQARMSSKCSLQLWHCLLEATWTPPWLIKSKIVWTKKIYNLQIDRQKKKEMICLRRNRRGKRNKRESAFQIKSNNSLKSNFLSVRSVGIKERVVKLRQQRVAPKILVNKHILLTLKSRFSIQMWRHIFAIQNNLAIRNTAGWTRI